MKLDAIHSKILEQLQLNARISNTAIAKQVGISSPAVTERIKKLEDLGIIEGYYAKVSHYEMGYDFRALITVRAFMGRLKPFLYMDTQLYVYNCFMNRFAWYGTAILKRVGVIASDAAQFIDFLRH